MITRTVPRPGRKRLARWLGSALAMALLPGCPDSPPGDCTDPTLVGALELGFRDGTGAFVAVADGDAIPISVFQAIPGFQPSMRAKELDPSQPQPSLSIYLAGNVIGAVRAGEPTDMVPDGDAFVLDNVLVGIQQDLCCFNCREVILQASLVDRNCHACEGQVRAILQFSETCPSEQPCCADASACLDPGTTQVCGQ